jgi:NAD(P)H-dependent FMN reductase
MSSLGSASGEGTVRRHLGRGASTVRTAPLKNVIDYLHWEWHYKPVGLVSYGGVAAGTRAAQMIKQVVTTLKMVPVFEAVSVPFVQQFLSADRNVRPNEVMVSAAKAMLDELRRVSETLGPLRTQGINT